ncbi:uroporphyrinogen-III synthase [Candidatus Pelagibacter ubique]|jgi:uroporphyrinogen-III synthase|uniref:Uroporphyrinogen-III synthase n=2 Tax=Pelagibacter ubique TaxID=198252 RepID=Q4FNV8_PELUB|nr:MULTISPECIES: uroporphyrinogen-III synthase [Pelagibacter]AAZ21131.1 Uroporphyrinogen III synthase HEM4 [Candidatus Pelagibacter ubique HTCC1062]EAS85012.1 Uroporphyrinogen III synthase [Candidatus Pelagibacter ubique HTCC1002]MDA7444259.1 uroporphyrinogen-III synthase [Candidatus Pelagibacter ubique]MDA7472304.1 uroporphyrinogen-III synthase [Candidatus Pelagibacter ubique]MDA7474060.1 uroporphyrinogen-III synthase [Candidatus Pelagibacter ubique]
MHILFTRPLEDCHEMILKFQSLGHEISHLPLINIEGLKYEAPNYSEFKAIIFTSANAVKFLDIKNIDKKLKCFCVGSATEKKARSVGFQNVFAAEGNVSNLKELILQNFKPSDGKLIYISGEIISSDLDKELISSGYTIERLINYRANPIEKYDESFIEKLKLKMPEITYIYSQNSAINFLKVIKNYQLETLWMNTNLMCIGEKTSSILNEIKWKKIFLFNPGEEEFLLYKI